MKAICTECKNEYTEWIGGDNTCSECEEIVNIYIPKEQVDAILLEEKEKILNSLKEKQSKGYELQTCIESLEAEIEVSKMIRK